MILTDWMLEILRESFKPTSRTMPERVLELAEFLEAEAIGHLPAWCPAEITSFLHSTAQKLRQWSAACRQVGV
jgi:hypothetical protein